MRDDDAHAFVTRNERHGRLDRPVAMGGVDVGVAQAAGFHLYKHLARTWLRNDALLKGQWTIERCDNCCSHDSLQSFRVLDALDSVSHEQAGQA